MTISFQKQEIVNSGYALPEKGPYFAKITKAEYRIPTETTKNPYLNITYEITNSMKERKGLIFDMLSTSDKDFPRYRFNRFMTALNLVDKQFGSYEDICKVLPNRELGIIIKEDNSEWVKQNPDKARMIIADSDGIYYTAEEIKGFMPEVTEAGGEGAVPFDIDEDF